MYQREQVPQALNPDVSSSPQVTWLPVNSNIAGALNPAKSYEKGTRILGPPSQQNLALTALALACAAAAAAL